MADDTVKSTILIVDDTETNIDILVDALGEEYELCVALDGESALESVAEEAPDLILLDIIMPNMDGYEVCRRLQADETTRGIPIIFVTAMGEERNETLGFSLGAVDYIAKPISIPIVKARVRTHLRLVEVNHFLKNQNQILEEKVISRTKKLWQLQDVTMVAMGAMAESRDPETGNHIRRTQHYVKLLATHLQDHPRFRHFLTPDHVLLLVKSAPLHDIGKVGVSDNILLKPGRLTAEEFEEMKKHVDYGRDAILAAEKQLDDPESFLMLAREIAYSHHEKWNGTGYPEGLRGNDIPISARLMAVADVYDALISRRVYKPAFPHEKAIAIIKEGSAAHFDADIVDAFIKLADKFLEIAEKYKDS